VLLTRAAMAACGEDCDDNTRVVAPLRGATTRVRNPSSSAPRRRYDAAAARGRRCRGGHPCDIKKVKLQSPVLQPPVVGAAKVGRRSCKGLLQVMQPPSPELQRLATAAATSSRRSYKGRLPLLQPPSSELQRSATAAATSRRRSCKGWPAATTSPRRSYKGRLSLLRAAKVGHRCCNLPSPELQRPGNGAASGAVALPSVGGGVVSRGGGAFNRS
jgi:hypothetical protein